MSGTDLSRLSTLDLFRMEAESQTQVLTSGLLTLERNHTSSEQLEACMRAAHSLKGAARIIGLTGGVRLAHAMEECFVAAQRGQLILHHLEIDRLLGGVDLLAQAASSPDGNVEAWFESQSAEIDACVASLESVLEGSTANTSSPGSRGSTPPADTPVSTVADQRDTSDRVLRVTAESLNLLLNLAGESRVESRWVKPFAQSLMRLNRLLESSANALDHLRETTSAHGLESGQAEVVAAKRAVNDCQQELSERLSELDMFDRRSLSLSHRLYDEALACRMRPFADGAHALPRLVRDLARELGKQVRVEITGEATQVDRDILQKLDAPLGHLLRNAIDHGIETPTERLAAGKPAEGVICLDARHAAGLLQIVVSDDGRGVDLARVRAAVVHRKLATPEAAAALSDDELIQFLFLPGFTMKETITEISGRGVGLDVVHDAVKQVRGAVRIFSDPGRGTRFQMRLPVTLSVVRTLLADIGGEPYAFPLAAIVRVLRIAKKQVQRVEGRQYIDLDGQLVGLVTAHQVLQLNHRGQAGDELSVIVLGEGTHSYGLIVDSFIGERELVVQQLDTHFGRIKDIAAGALMEDGTPVLIVDPEDLIRSMERLAAAGSGVTAAVRAEAAAPRQRKRVLVVDDSLTVRELERKLLENHGYDVEVAVDGMDGWNAVRGGQFNLVVTDVDMPRMDGIELVSLIGKDPNLKSIPVMIVSYKDRDEDRRRGLEAGAAHYLTKGSFQEDMLVQAVVDLIGEAEA